MDYSIPETKSIQNCSLRASDCNIWDFRRVLCAGQCPGPGLSGGRGLLDPQYPTPHRLTWIGDLPRSRKPTSPRQSGGPSVQPSICPLSTATNLSAGSDFRTPGSATTSGHFPDNLRETLTNQPKKKAAMEHIEPSEDLAQHASL